MVRGPSPELQSGTYMKTKETTDVRQQTEDRRQQTAAKRQTSGHKRHKMIPGGGGGGRSDPSPFERLAKDLNPPPTRKQGF
jgi:hypothetical protein